MRDTEPDITPCPGCHRDTSWERFCGDFRCPDCCESECEHD